MVDVSELMITIEERWKYPFWKYFALLAKWPVQILLLFGQPGRNTLLWLNDRVLEWGGCEIKIGNGAWEPVYNPNVCTYTNKANE